MTFLEPHHVYQLARYLEACDYNEALIVGNLDSISFDEIVRMIEKCSTKEELHEQLKPWKIIDPLFNIILKLLL